MAKAWIDKTAGHHGVVGRLVEPRHAQEQREFAPVQVGSTSDARWQGVVEAEKSAPFGARV